MHEALEYPTHIMQIVKLFIHMDKCIRFETNFNIHNKIAVDFLHFTLERGGESNLQIKK